MTKQVKISCQGATTLDLEELTILQGDLKDLSETNYEKLKSRILERGFSFPFFIWPDKKTGTNWILDGTHRKLVLIKLKEEGYSIPKLPCDIIEASNIKEAKAKLLECTSNYAKISHDGFLEFTADLNLEEIEQNIDLPDFSIPQVNVGLSEPDYSLLEDAELDFSKSKSGVKKAILVEFEPDDYDKALSLFREIRSSGYDLGKEVLQALEGFFESE